MNRLRPFVAASSALAASALLVAVTPPATLAQAPTAVEAAGPIAGPGELGRLLKRTTIDEAPRSRAPQRFNGALTTIPTSRGSVSMYFDDFSSYPRSTDPIFDRFQVSMQDQTNPQGGLWDISQSWYIPTLCVDGQFDDSEPPLPDLLPRWQGVDLDEDAGLGVLTADLNNDGGVDSADLGILLGSFGASGAPGFSVADINADGVIDTADLGIILGQFGQSIGFFCLYQVDAVHTTDPGGFPLAQATIDNGPAIADTIAIFNGAYSNDLDTDGCPDCVAFRIAPDGGATGESVYGDWTLIDPEHSGVFGVEFTASVASDTCAGWGAEECLCDARAETAIIENACCFFGARCETPLFAATIDEPVIADIDVFLTDIKTFRWIDWTSSAEGFAMIAGRAFLGGYAPSLTSDFLTFANPQGYMDRPVFLGTDADGAATYFSTIPNAGLGADGFQYKLNEWFTLRLVVKHNEMQIWFNDSETRTLTDPAPGDNGDATPLDGSDDIEDGFAKVFPTGPFGPAIGTSLFPTTAQIPQPLLSASSIDTVRLLWAGDPTPSEDPAYEVHNTCYDNILITGELVVFPTPPAFSLPYADDIEVYNAGGALTFQGGRWFDLGNNQAYIDDSLSSSSSQSVCEDSAFPDGGYRPEFGTALPIASANTAPWTLGVDVALSGFSAVRAVALNDNTFGIDPFDPAVARLLIGVENDNGVVVLDGSGHPRLHLRVRNPNFTPAIEPDDSAQPDAAPDVPPVNSHWINVPTDAMWDDTNTFHRFTFEVDAAQNLTVRRDGVVVVPDPTLAPLAGYAAPGWTAGSVAVDELAFESGNQTGSLGESIWVDDVTLDGADPVIATGPPTTLPYSEGFEDYPANAPIDGQADGRYAGPGDLVIDDPTGSGRGHVLRGINAHGFNTDGHSYYLDVTLPGSAAYATGSTDCVLEVDCYVTDSKSRYALDFDGPNGSVTALQLGGPDIDYDYLSGFGSPGSLPIPETNFALLEVNPHAGGPFGMGPDAWYHDTGTQVPLNAWFRIRVTVSSNGPTDNSYTVEVDASGIPGGDGVFEITIDTDSGEETGGPSEMSGMTITARANAIDGLDTITGLDSGGDGVFLRDPIEVLQLAAMPVGPVFPDDFCFYLFQDFDGIFLGIPPAPCNDFRLSDIIGVARNAALPDWPNGGVAENSPESRDFVWVDALMTGQCAGQWRWLDPDDPEEVDFPNDPSEVTTWADFTLIPPYADPGPTSRWCFDNITLDGSPTP
ncbi:MAG: hypothetical protein H6813_07535 [Phycisphaeraceae bacterium]|nr:hypothetical protein [Phycisphaeraceae bacterium]MCB9848347.1 hypothetical protein [Phycisphaeraceae bacterium]